MNVPPIIATHVCRHCGAHSQSSEGKCWLCYADKATGIAANPYAENPYEVMTPAVSSQAANPTGSRIWDSLFISLMVICVILTILISIGLGLQEPGSLIAFWVFVGPAYVITGVRGLIQSGTSKVRPASLFITFALSILFTVLLSIVLAVAAAILLFVTCLQAMGPH